jgi:ABC-2 type transport system permease protein
MDKILKVAQREYSETVKTKAFILSILALPVVVVAIIIFAGRLADTKSSTRPPMKVAVTDLSEELSDEIKTSFEKHRDRNPKRQILLQELSEQGGADAVEAQGKDKLRQGQIDVYIVLDESIVEGSGKMRLYTYKPKPAHDQMLGTIEYLLREVVVNRRYELQQLDRESLAKLRNVPTDRVEIGSTGDTERVQSKTDVITRMMAPFFFMYLLFLGIVGTGQQMLSSIIEEKSSRIIEVLLSAVSPFQLMAGKIVGQVGISLTVVSLWGSGAYLAARSRGLNVEIPPEMAPYFAVYFILGFLLFSSIMVGIGSICNTIKETQSLMMPVILTCVVPMIAWMNIVGHPDGTMARVLSFIPPMTPMVMILRLSAGSDIWIGEVLASVLVLAAAALATIWLAAKVFRTGILMYGKRPGLREVVRWLGQK